MIEQWTTWCLSLQFLTQLKIPRVLIPCVNNDSPPELHVCADASESALCAVAYVRTEQEDGSIDVRLCMSRGKIAPIRKKPTLPRLELMALDLGATLSSHISSALDIDQTDLYLWTDSTTTLDWLAIEESSLLTFVKNRCINIRKRTLSQNVRWLPGNQNPADIGTRSVTTDAFLNNDQWFNGPEFLHLPRSEWPPIHSPGKDKQVIAEVRKTSILTTVSYRDDTLSRFLAVRPWTKCVRLVARLLRVVRRTANREAIDIDELSRAELVLTSWSQAESFFNELSVLQAGGSLPTKHKLSRLGLYLDNSSLDSLPLLRLKGRTQLASHLKFESKCPLPIDMGNQFTVTLVEHYPRCVLQFCGGVNTLLSVLLSLIHI